MTVRGRCPKGEYQGMRPVLHDIGITQKKRRTGKAYSKAQSGWNLPKKTKEDVHSVQKKRPFSILEIEGCWGKARANGVGGVSPRVEGGRRRKGGAQLHVQKRETSSVRLTVQGS